MAASDGHTNFQIPYEGEVPRKYQFKSLSVDVSWSNTSQWEISTFVALFIQQFKMQVTSVI